MGSGTSHTPLLTYTADAALDAADMTELARLERLETTDDGTLDAVSALE